MVSQPYSSYPYNNCPPPPQQYGVSPMMAQHHQAQQFQNPGGQMFMNYPLKGIPHPHAHDVLCGRGGQSNSHPGNMQWRTLVAANKELYVSLPKKQKMLLSQSIVNAVRSQSPPGRFLGKDSKSDTWYDVGDKRAQEKTSQALREGAPEIRKNLRGKGSEKKETKPPPKTEEPQRSASKEEMPPPSITIAVPPPTPPTPTSSKQVIASAASMNPPEPKHPKPPASMSSPPQQPPANGEGKISSDPVPAPPTQITEGELSFGSMGLMTDTEQARLMHAFSIGSAMSHQNTGEPHPQASAMQQPASFPPNEVVQPVDGGLEPVGPSFGSMMSFGTIPGNGNLERGGLSIGSTMSYSVCNEPIKLGAGGSTNYSHPQDFAGAPDLQDIGTSFGSLTLAPGERERIIKDAHEEIGTASAAAPPPTFLEQQRSRGNLLDCEDSDDEDASAQTSSVNKSEGWERLQAAIAAQKTTTMAPPPMLGPRYDGPPASFHMPTGLQRDFSNMSTTSFNDQFFQQQQQQQQQQLYQRYTNTATDQDDDEPLPLNDPMPPPPPVMKKSDNWAEDDQKVGYQYAI